MSDQKSVCIVIKVLGRPPYVDDLVFAARHDQALGKRRRGRHDGERVDEFLAVCLDGAIPCWRAL